MLKRKQTRRLRAVTWTWRGVVCALVFCVQSGAQAAWKENCQSSYEPLDVAPALPAAVRNLETTTRADAQSLEERLRSHLITQARLPTPIWNDTTSQDLVREVQEFLFRQKPEALKSVRLHWLLLMLAQRQWDILEPALKQESGSLTVWLQAETRLGLRDFSAAFRLFQRLDEEALRPWLSWRRMETLHLLGQSEGSLEQLARIQTSALLAEPRVREKFQTFLQSFAMRGRAIQPLLKQLQSKGDQDAIGQVAFCVLTQSQDTNNREAALDAVLNFAAPHSQSLRLASQEIEKRLKEPVAISPLLNTLETYTRHAAARLQKTDKQRTDDAFLFAATQQKAGEFLLKNRSVRESSSLLERLAKLMQNATAALPPSWDMGELQHLRGRILQEAHRYADAARLYRQLALEASLPSQQRLFANLMLTNFGQAAANLATDESFMDACRIYQKLVPDGRQELSRCDLMMARQSLKQGLSVDAQQRLWQIVYAFPEAIEGQTAAERLIELTRSRPDDLYMTTDKLLNIRSFQSGPWGIKLKDLRRQSSYQRIAQLSPSDQAEAYFVFAQKEKGDPLASRSLLSAVTLDQNAGRLARAMDRLETWLHDYPNSHEAPTRLLILIELAERTVQIPRARRYLQWTLAYPWTGEQQDFILQKTCLFDTLEQPLLGLRSCEKLGAHLTQGIPLRLRLARALAYGGYSEELQDYAMKQLLPREDLSVDQKMLVLDLLRRAKSLTPTREDTIRTTMTNFYLEMADRLGPESRRMLGGLAYHEARKGLAPFQALPIYGTRSDELISSIQTKKQAYDELESLYNKVLQTRDPHWGSSALCDLALAAENFAEALNRLPEVEGLDRKRIMSQIASQIASWRAKAKSASGAASKTIERFGILHGDNPRIIQEANRLKDDVIQFHDWIPTLLEGEDPASHNLSWTRWDEVAAALLTASQKNAGAPPASLMLQAINFVLHQRDFVRAEWLIERLLQTDDPTFLALGHWQQGRLEARLDQFTRAEEHWQKALALQPDHPEVRKQLGLLYARFGFFAKALQLLQPLEQDAQIAWTLVAIERQLERNEAADHRCEQLIAPGSATAAALYNCSLLEFQNHRHAAKAITWMQQALAAAESSPALAARAREQLALMQVWKARFQPDH
jgi:tetratricopeptide (TPR) repeat protein